MSQYNYLSNICIADIFSVDGDPVEQETTGQKNKQKNPGMVTF